MLTRILSLIFLCLVGCAVMVAPAQVQAQSPNGLAVFGKSTISIVSGDKTHSFRVELALTHQQQMQGLMFRRRMAPDAGMLFVYKREEPIAMWMKNTYIPLDMLFIARDGKIVKIAERTVPLSQATISSGGEVVAVLELNAGTASRLGIGPGDRVQATALGTAP
mgnify:FL=1